MLDLSWFSWEGLIDIARPEVILIIFQSLMPFSLIVFFVTLFLGYWIAKKFLIKHSFHIINYILIFLSSVLIIYFVLIVLTYILELGFASLSRYM